jgi:type 1 glutamine amidotransferase
MESVKETTTFTDSIVFDVIKEIAERAEAGLNKYGTTMDRTDLIASDWVQHAYEEALDMAIYLKRLRKDMLAMEEKFAVYKEEYERISMMKEKHTLVWTAKKPDNNVTITNGTGVVYTMSPKPNETYTDEEPVIRKKYNWHR